MLKTVLILLFLILGVSLAPDNAYAIKTDIGIYPPIFQFKAYSVNNILEAPFTLENFSDNDIDLETSLKTFTPSGNEDGSVTYSNKNNSEDQEILKQIEVSDNNLAVTKITLQPKQKKNLVLKIRLTKELARKDYCITLFFNSAPRNSLNTNSSSISISIGSHILLSLDPNSKTRGYVKEFSSKTIGGTTPTMFKLSITNNSKHLISPTGKIEINNIFNQKVESINLLPVNILSNSSRIIPDTNNTSTSISSSKKLIPGLYNANLNISLSDTGPYINRKLYFIIFPIKFVFLSIISATLIVSIFLRATRIRKTK